MAKDILTLPNDNESISDFMIRLYETSNCEQYGVYANFLTDKYKLDKTQELFIHLKKSYYWLILKEL